MSFISFRRYYLDQVLKSVEFYGEVLDVGGKKDNKRGEFRPPLNSVKSWKYLNIDASVNPDYCCSAENIPTDDNSFDVVLMTEVLEHLKTPELVIKECYRVLKPSGKMIITVPFLNAVHADPYDYQRWTSEKIKIEFEKAGFKVINIEAMGSFFGVFYDLLRTALSSTSKNPAALKNKIINKFIMPQLARIFLELDKKYHYKSNKITTGYFGVFEKTA